MIADDRGFALVPLARGEPRTAADSHLDGANFGGYRRLSRVSSGRDRPPVLCGGSAAHVERLVFDGVEELDSECAALDTQPGVFSGGLHAPGERLARADVDHS